MCTRNSSCKCPMCDMSAETAMLEQSMQQNVTLVAEEPETAATEVPASPEATEPAVPPSTAVASSPPLPASSAPPSAMVSPPLFQSAVPSVVATTSSPPLKPAAVANSPPLHGSQGTNATVQMSEFPEGAVGAAPPHTTEEDFSALPLAKRLVHKKWSVRKNACAALGALFEAEGVAEATAAATDFAPLLTKLVKDSNAKVVDTALDAVLGFLRRWGAADAPTLALAEPPKLLPALCRAAFNGRAATVAKGQTALRMAVEDGLAAATLEALLGGIDEKKPKVPPLCVSALKELVAAFGTGALGKESVLSVLKKLRAMMGSLNGAVRDSTLALVAELLRWLPQAVLEPHLAGLRKAQESAVIELFAAASAPGGATPTHFVGGAGSAAAAAAAAAGGGGAAGGKSDAAAAREFAEEVDLVAALEKTSFAADAAAKGEKLSWKKRVAALDLLLTTVGPTPKLSGSGAEHSDIVGTLTLLAADANSNIMVKSTRGLAALASGLQKEFSLHARATLRLMLGQLKNKTTASVAATFACLDALADSGCITLDQEKTRTLLANTISHTKNKAAPAREATMKWLGTRVEADTPASPGGGQALSDGALEWLACIFCSALADTDTKCRKAVIAGLSSLLRRCPDATAGTKLTGAGPVGAVLAKVPTAHKKVVEALLKPPAKAPAAKTRRASESSVGSAGSTGDAAPKKLALKRAGSKKTGSSSALGDTPAVTSAAADEESAADGDSSLLDAEAAEVQVLALGLTAEQLESLSDGSKWMGQEAAVQAIRAAIEALPEGTSAGTHAVAVVSLLGMKLAKIKDFVHPHVKVMKALIELWSSLCARSTQPTPFPRKLLKHLVPAAIDKFSDKKLAEAAGAALLAMAEATAPAPVVTLSLERLAKAKTPAVLVGGLGFLGTAASEFGVKFACPTDKGKALVAHAKSASGLGSSNAAVRTAAIELLAAMYTQLGPALDAQVEDVKPTLLKTLKAAFEKAGFDASSLATGPKRTARGAGAITSAAGTKGGDGPNLGEAVKEHLDKIDVSEGKDAWKQRNAAINAITAVCEPMAKVAAVTGVYAELSRETEQLVRNLAKRLATESQKNVKVRATRLLGLVAGCLGPKCAKYSKLVGDELLKCAADNNKSLRDTALCSMEAWVASPSAAAASTPSPGSAFESLLHTLPVAMARLVGRTELLQWVATHAAARDLSAKAAQLEELVNPTFECLLDKTPEARVAAETVLAQLAKYVARDHVNLLLGDLKPAAVRTIRPIVNRVFDEVAPAGATAIEVGSALAPAASAPEAAAKKKMSGGTGAVAAPEKTVLGVDLIEQKVSAALKVAAGTNGPEDGTLRKGKAGAKARRAEKARRMKWHFEESGPTTEHRDTLRDAMEKHVHAELFEKLFKANDNSFQQTIEALRLLAVAATEQPEETAQTLDLLLKWCTLQLCSNNTNVLNAALDYLTKLFDGLGSRGYTLQDFEAECFLPIVVDKVGHSKARFREKLRSLMRLACAVCATPARYVSFAMAGLSSKNMRSRSICLEEVARLMPATGSGALTGSSRAAASNLALVTKLADAAEKDVREAAVSVLAALHGALRREGRADTPALFWKALSDGRCDVPAKVKDLVNARVKVEEKKAKALAAMAASSAATKTPSAAPLLVTPSGTKAAATANSAAVAGTPALHFATPCHTPTAAADGPTPHHVAISPSDCGGGDPYMFDDAHIKLSAPPAVGSEEALDVEAFDSRFSEVLERIVSLRALYASDAPRPRVELAASPLYTQGRDALKIVFRMAAAAQGATAADQRVALFVRHVEPLFARVGECLEHAFGARPDDVVDLNLLALALAVLCALLKIAPVAAALPVGALASTLERVIVRLPDHRLAPRATVATDSAQKLVGALNMVVLQAVESCARADVYSALLALLQRCIGTTSVAPEVRDAKATQLAVKLFLKVIKLDLKEGAAPFAVLLGGSGATGEGNDAPGTGVEAVLTALHGFFAAVPPEEAMLDDTPFKAANTLLRTLLVEGALDADTTGAMRRMAFLPATSPMHALLQAHDCRVKEGPRNASAAGPPMSTPPSAGATPAAPAAAAMVPSLLPVAGATAGALSDEKLRQHLTALFARLCDPASADDTLRELHSFTTARATLRPAETFNLFDFMPPMSSVFKAYLQGELQKMGGEVAAEQAEAAKAAAKAAAKVDQVAAATAAAAATTAAAAVKAEAEAAKVAKAAPNSAKACHAAVPPAPPAPPAPFAAAESGGAAASLRARLNRVSASAAAEEEGEIDGSDTKENGGGTAESLRARLNKTKQLAVAAAVAPPAQGLLSSQNSNTVGGEVAPAESAAAAPAVRTVTHIAPAPAAIMGLKERLAALKQSAAKQAQTFG